jgi:hypothetical protein
MLNDLCSLECLVKTVLNIWAYRFIHTNELGHKVSGCSLEEIYFIMCAMFSCVQLLVCTLIWLIGLVSGASHVYQPNTARHAPMSLLPGGSLSLL